MHALFPRRVLQRRIYSISSSLTVFEKKALVFLKQKPSLTMCFKHAPYWHQASSLSPDKSQLLYNCKQTSALYLSLSILSTVILSTAILYFYGKQILGYNSLVVRGCMRIVPTWNRSSEFPLHLHFRYFLCIHFLWRCPLLSITQDFQVESVAESHFPGHHLVTKITRPFPAILLLS